MAYFSVQVQICNTTHEQAKANLLQRGYKPEMMFGAVINTEIYRLMEE